MIDMINELLTKGFAYEKKMDMYILKLTNLKIMENYQIKN